MCAPSHKFVELYLRNEGIYRQLEKKLVKQQYHLHIFSQYANFGPLAAEIGLPVWTPQQILTDFASWLRYCSERRRLPEANQTAILCGWYTWNGVTELSQKAPPVFDWAAITLGIRPHSSYELFCPVLIPPISFAYLFLNMKGIFGHITHHSILDRSGLSGPGTYRIIPINLPSSVIRLVLSTSFYWPRTSCKPRQLPV